MQILVDEAHIRIISKDRKSAQRKMMRLMAKSKEELRNTER